MLWKTVLIVLATILCAALAEHTRVKRRMYAMCPPNFKRIGSECYYISSSRLNWLDAHFECKDKNSKLAEPGSSADRKLRSYLKATDTDTDEIWIGGCYDWNTHKWHWGYNGKEITHQSFSRLDPGSSLDLRYHCAVLNPMVKYRWSARSSVDRHRFICQHKMPKVSEKNRFKVYNRWNETYPNQLANEVLLEIVDSGENGTRTRRVKAVDSNDVFTIPTKRRPSTVRRRRKRPNMTTPGYQGTEPYVNSPSPTDLQGINGHIGALDIKDGIAQFVPDSRHEFKPASTRNEEDTTSPDVRIRGQGRQRQNRPQNDANVETNETVINSKQAKRQKTEFDREIEIKRRRAQQRRRKMEQHRKWRQEQREKAKKEKEEREQAERAKEEERLRIASEREAEERRRIEEQKEIKRRQMEELEELKQQQIEQLERERKEAELAHKRRMEIERQQQEARERQEAREQQEDRDRLDNEKLEKERLEAEQKRLEEEERLRKEREYEEEFQKRHKLEHEEKERERIRQEEVKKLEEEKQRQEEEYRRIQEEREQEERKRMQEELDRLEEEAKRREERKKAREEEIKRREELFKQQEEEEKRLREEIKRREEEERIAREEEQRRKEEEERQKKEEEERKKKELEEKRRLKELRREKAENNRKTAEEEEKRLKLQRLRERLAKLSPEEQKKFFELRQQRKMKRVKENSENESTIPE